MWTPFGFLLQAAILYVILLFVGRHQGDTSYSTLFYISLGVSIVAFVSAIYIPQFAIVVTSLVCILAIQKFCYIGWIRSIVATILYVAWMIVWPILFLHATR